MDAVTAWMDGYFDPGTALLAYPGAQGAASPLERPGVHLVRESTWYALGLLERGQPGDAERADSVLSAVLAQQVLEGGVAYGTFRRTPEEPPLPAAPREWIDYDPNWREFIGTTLVVLLARHESALAPATVSAIDVALGRACQGALEREVSAEYTNIALMSAFLLDWVGDRLGEPGYRSTATALGRAVSADHARTGAFRELNSPTYYGTDLVALALWRELARNPWLRAEGERLEAVLWNDVARFWHAGLGNLCGPYTRAYGMDGSRYVSGLALCIEAALPAVAFPRPILPDLGGAMAHAHDRCKAPLVTVLGPRIPAAAAPHFAGFQGERSVEQRVQSQPFERRVTAWLGEELMLGGEDASGHHVHHQHHPATAHWREADGSVGWLRLRTPAPVRARATPGRLEVIVETRARWLAEAAVAVEVTLCTGSGPRAEAAGVARLALPNGSLALSGLPAGAAFVPADGEPGQWRASATFQPGRAPERLELELRLEP